MDINFNYSNELKFLKRMNYTFLPSLEHIALVKIATSFWNQSDIRGSLIEEDYISLKNIEEKIKEKVLLLDIPSSLREKILCVLKPIGLEICSWMRSNKESYNLAVNLPDEFSWTPHGLIDRKKTAEALMTDESIDITERYKLACINCLNNYVGEMWEKMPENHRASFYSADDPRKVAQHDLVSIWTYGLKGEKGKLENIIRWRTYENTEMTEACTPEQYPLKCAFIHCNKVAAEYFWSKLSLEDREDSLRFMVNIWVTYSFNVVEGDSDFFDILPFLLIRVNKDQQITLFEKIQWEVLSCFLKWPWQRLFMDMTNYVVLTNSADYYSLLLTIVTKVNLGYKDYDYQRLFGEFWQKSTEYNKKYVIDMLCEDDLLLCLFENKDMKNISLILKDLSVQEIADLRNSVGSCIFVDLYCTKEFDMLEFFIKEFISSSELMIKFKDECMRELLWLEDGEDAPLENIRDDLEKFLDEHIEKFNLKRNTEQSNCSSAKRLCRSLDV